jgi:MOSC domain-containing protein YiiM
MELLDSATVGVDTGIGSDSRGVVRAGSKGNRQVTVLAKEAWDLACQEVGERPVWTSRRANLLVEGLALPTVAGAKLRIGTVELLVTGETEPCSRMDEVVSGLRAALTPDWRGGVTCRVLSGGEIAIGDTMTMDA